MLILCHQAFGTCSCKTITSCCLFSVSYLSKAAASGVINTTLSSFLLSPFLGCFFPPFLGLSITPSSYLLPSFLTSSNSLHCSSLSGYTEIHISHRYCAFILNRISFSVNSICIRPFCRYMRKARVMFIQ